jgi:hypothetical protein
LRDDVTAVDHLAVPVVPVRGDQHARLELREMPDGVPSAPKSGEQHAHTPFRDVPTSKTLDDLKCLTEEIMPKVNAA